jgi:hypothetical protein
MRRALLATVALLALAGPAAAQFRHRPEGPPPPGEGVREHLFISPAGEPFREGDGLAAWFAGADADHDGTLTAAEFRADMLRYFKVLDANHDGRLDGFEIQAYEQDIVPEITRFSFDGPPPGFGGRGRRSGGEGAASGGTRIRGGGGFGDFRQGAARYGLLNVAQPVANADEDVDGKVSQDEWVHAATRRFAMLDKAGAGKLTLEELRNPRAEEKKKERAKR